MRIYAGEPFFVSPRAPSKKAAWVYAGCRESACFSPKGNNMGVRQFPAPPPRKPLGYMLDAGNQLASPRKGIIWGGKAIPRALSKKAAWVYAGCRKSACFSPKGNNMGAYNSVLRTPKKAAWVYTGCRESVHFSPKGKKTGKCRKQKIGLLLRQQRIFCQR